MDAEKGRMPFPQGCGHWQGAAPMVGAHSWAYRQHYSEFAGFISQKERQNMEMEGVVLG